MKTLFRFTILFVLIFSISACAPSQADDNPAAVFEALDVAWNAKDVEGVLASYADDAVERNSRGLFYGKDDLRDILTAAIDAFALDCGNYIVGENKVYYECLSTFYSDGRLQGERYEAVVVSEKIQVNISVEKFVPQKEFKIDSSLP